MAQAALRRIDGPISGGDRYYRAGASPSIAHDFVQPDVAPRLVRILLELRMERESHFPKAINSDVCWTVLLHLYAAHVDQHRLFVSTLTQRSGIPGTTVLRALDALFIAGFAAKSADQLDRRRSFVALTAAGEEAMRSFMIKTGARAVYL